MSIRSMLSRDASRNMSSKERTRQRVRSIRRAAFRGEVARHLRVESLEQRMMLAADIGVSGTDIVLTDIGAGSANDIVMDYSAGTLTIEDTTGLAADATLQPYMVGNTLTMTAANLITEGITDIVLDTGDEADTIVIKGTPDPSVATSFTGMTSVLSGADDDSISLGSGNSLDKFFSPVDVDGGTGNDDLDLVDWSGTPDPLVTITLDSVIGIAQADITYSNIASLSVDVVDGSPANIVIESTSAATEVLLDSGADETITFGDAGDMSGIQGTVLLTDFFGGGNDTLNYDDSAFGGGRVYTLAPDGSLTATGIANITVASGVYEHVVLQMGGGVDTVTITPDTTTTYDVSGGGGNDTFNVTGSPGAPAPVDLDGGAGDDTFNVTVLPGSVTVIDIVGGADNDTLNLDVTGTADPELEIIPTLNGGDGDFTFTGTVPVTFTEIETLNVTGGIDELSIREDLSPDFVDGADDTIMLSQINPHLAVGVNGVPQIRVGMAGLSLVTVEGSADNDTLVIDNGGGLVNLNIDFNGNGQTSTPGDSLVIQGNPGVAIARETYRVGATQDAGTLVLDPDDSAGPGAGGTLNGDELVVTFTGLEPLDTSTPVAVFDVILTAAVDDVALRDGGLLDGFNSIKVLDLGATFETVRFANKATARINGVLGADIFRVEYTTAAAGLTTLEAYGHLAPGIPGPADDDAGELVTLHSTGANITSIYTQGGTDRVQDRSFILDGLNGTVNVIGGESAGDNDYLNLQDTADAGPDAVTITDSAITGAAPATINYSEIEKLFFESTVGDDTIDILSTAADVETFVTGDGGNDTVTVGNQTADFGTTFDGSLDAVAGPLAVSGDFNGAAGDDTLNVDDSGTASLNGAATIDNGTYTFDLAGVGTSFDGPVTVLDGFAPAPIRYFYDTIAPFGMDPRMEFLNVLGSTGDDDITVEVTTAVDATTIDTREGSDLITVNGDGLSAANTFSGGDDADAFVLDITTNLGDASFVDLTSLEFAGNDPAATTAERDTLAINDASGAARDLIFDYLDTAGDLDINPGVGGGLGAGAEDIPVMVRTMESVIYAGTGTDDTIAIDGTSADDDLTVAPYAADAAMVFLGGNPWDGPDDVDTFPNALPGVAGGGNGPDLQLMGVDNASGLVVNDGAGTNRLFIYGLSDVGLDDGSGVDHFGFGAGKIMPNASDVAADGYDTIAVTDTSTLVNGYVPVLYNTTDFVQADPVMDRAIIINAGAEANPPATAGIDVADDITLTPSGNYLIQINGGDPDPVTTGIVPPDGDRLNVVSPSDEIDIYSDKSVPPNVSISFGGALLPFNVTSIENLSLDANGGTVNLIGDDNNTTPQHDNFVVVGRDIDGNPADGGYQELQLVINGSNPININSVQFLNAIGYEMTDTLEVTPYADNTPRGWGIDVRYDEGNPVQDDGEQVDLLIYNTAMFNNVVSENIVIQPSGAEDGELRVTNGAFGTPIVTISYINNLDIIVNDNDGGLSDTDTLTLRGTNPDNIGTSGVELVEADFSAAGDLANPLVIVTDLDPVVPAEPILYRVRDIVGFDTVTIDTMDGIDVVSLIGRDDGSMAINVVDGDVLLVPGTAGDDDVVQVGAGPHTDAGRLWIGRAGATAATQVQFVGTTDVVVDGGGGAGADTVTVAGTDGDDQFTLAEGSGPGMGDLATSFGPTISVQDLGSDDSTFVLLGNGGDDAFSIEPLDGVLVTVDGGDPTASDTVVIKGTAGDDAIGVAPLDDTSATVTVNAMAPVAVTAVELLTLDGLAGNDVLTVETDAADNTIELTPGATTDAGEIQVDSLLPMEFTNLSAGGSVVLNDAEGLDTFVYNGTAATDSFTVGAATVFLDARVPVTTINVDNYKLRGLGGDDAFTVQSQTDIAILVEGDGPSGSDTLNYAADASGGDPVVIVELDSDLANDPFLQTIEQDGFAIITHTGIESVNMDIEGGDLYVSGTRGDDVISFAPLSEDSGVLTAEYIATTYFIDDVPADKLLVITGGDTGRGGPVDGGFADKVVLLGTRGSDLIRVDAPNREVSLDVVGFGSTDAWRAVTLDDGTAAFGTAGIIESVEVRGNDGNDTVYVAPDAPVGNGLFVKVDGGSPRASDALVITDIDGAGDPVAFGANVFVVVGQSRVPDAGNVLVFEDADRLPGIAYENIEVVSPNVDSGDNLLILGPDVYEQNEYVQTAAYIGSGEALNVTNLAIFPNATEHPGVPADQDYFRFVADTTGTMDFQVYFNVYADTLLPAGGNIDIEVLDVAGNVVAGGGDFGNHDDTADARVRVPVVAGQTYYLHVYGATEDVVNGYDMTITNVTPPVPYDIELLDIPVDPDYDPTVDPPANNSDTGRSNEDNVTADNSPAILVRLDDGIFLHDLPGNPDDGAPADELIPIPFNPSLDPLSTDAGYRVAIYVEGDPQQPGVGPQTVIGYAQPGAEEGVYEFDFDDAIVAGAVDLMDGSHFISARVEMLDPADPTQHGYGDRSESLEIVVDTEVPPIDLLDLVDDGECAYAPDNVTHDTSPGFFGTAEANAIVRFYVDINGDGALQIATDFYLGLTVAIPLDGNNQFPEGYFEFTTPIELNDEQLLALGLDADGLRTIFATAEDLAGNVTPEDQAIDLRIFLDTQGPQITDVYVTADPAYDLFDPKPSTDGPSPLVNSLTIDIQDLPARVAAEFLYPALVQQVAEHPGHYQLVGDANGIIPIADIIVTLPVPGDGEIATGTIELVFANPLPDDRFTLTVSDSLIDPVCNKLDGESNASEPQENPLFPTGDGVPGGDFVARFTIDSRPELAVWAAGNIWVDTNGNFVFDPTNEDFTNRDIIYQMGYTSDDVFAGNFANDPADVADGFDKLAVYGRVNGQFRWLVDTDNDGVADIEQVDPLNINGLPVAGEFDGNTANGDEVGLFTGSVWYFDTNHDFQLDAASALPSNLVGYPVVGDFDGDGFDDLGTWADDYFRIDLANGALRGWDGVADETFRFGYIGVRARPVAADMNMDGIDDLGLWLPDRSGVLPRGSGEWQFLISEDPDNVGVSMSVLDRIDVDPINGENRVTYTPVPFGPDMFAQFGDDYALPVVGNFDPPVTGGSSGPSGNLHTNLDEPNDVNDDGFVSPIDALLVITALNNGQSGRLEGAASEAPYLDVNMDGFLSPIDALSVITRLNSGEGEGEGEGLVASTLSDDLLAATTPPAGEGALGGGLLSSEDGLTTIATVGSNVHLTLPTPSSSQAASDAVNFGLVDSETLEELAESMGADELFETLPLDEAMDELAVLMSHDGESAVDEFFRGLGDV